MTDAAALLHGERGFFHVLKNRAEVVGDLTHDEAVEQRHLAPCARPSEDAPGRQELKVRHRLIEALRPVIEFSFCFHHGRCSRHTPPAFLNRTLGFPSLPGEAIFLFPDLLGDRQK